MTRDEKREAYRAKCRAAELARREALGIPAWPPAKPARKARRVRQPRDAFDPLDNLDNLGESPDF